MLIGVPAISGLALALFADHRKQERLRKIRNIIFTLRKWEFHLPDNEIEFHEFAMNYATACAQLDNLSEKKLSGLLNDVMAAGSSGYVINSYIQYDKKFKLLETELRARDIWKRNA